MDGAAQEITKLAQHILPQRPHHLAVSPTARYSVPSGLWPNTSPLQYTTYVSEADRGILLTRPYYDIQLDPDEDIKVAPSSNNNRSKTVPSADASSSAGTPTAANSKGQVKKAITKLSFKDYQQSKQQKKQSGSPSDTPKDTAKDTSKDTPKDTSKDTTNDTLLSAKLDAKPSTDTAAMAHVERHRLPPKPEFNDER